MVFAMRKIFIILLFLILALAMSFSGTGVAFAMDQSEPTGVVGSGNCGIDGNNLIWTLYDDGRLIISGTGAMSDSWHEDRGYDRALVKRIVIEEGVTSIGSSAFYLHDKLEEVVIADTVSLIGEYAFSNCRYMHSINIPFSADTISKGLFKSCWSLTEITIPDNIKTDRKSVV